MRRLICAITLCVAACGNPTGKTCKVDDDCGPGYDCFPDVCVPVCTKDDDCPARHTCFRYHCVAPGEEHAHPHAASPAPSAPTTLRAPPPAPDATVAELRAIRRELELLRAEQTRLADALGQKTGKPPVKKNEPTKPAVVVPTLEAAKPVAPAPGKK